MVYLIMIIIQIFHVVSLAFMRMRLKMADNTTLEILHGCVYEPISDLSSYIVISPKQDIEFTNDDVYDFTNIIDPATVSSLTPITAFVINNFIYNTLTKDNDYESNNYISGEINTEIISSLQTLKFINDNDAYEGYNLYCEQSLNNNISAEITNISPDFFEITCEPELTTMDGNYLKFPISVNGESDKSCSGIVSADLIIHNNINGKWIQISNPYTISAEYNFYNDEISIPDDISDSLLTFVALKDNSKIKLNGLESTNITNILTKFNPLDLKGDYERN